MTTESLTVPISDTRPWLGDLYRKTGKRALDIVVAAPGLVITLPLIGTLALVNKALDPQEAAFYSTVRIGKDGSPIKLWKIRTVKTDPGGERPVDQVELSRFNRFNLLLRRTGLDELPQLWSVLKGELTLFGPRAIPSWDMDNVRSSIMADNDQDAAVLFERWKRAYLSSPPGLVGWAQVSGSRDLSAIERARLDLEQVENTSFGSDLRMFVRTVRATINGQGRR